MISIGSSSSPNQPRASFGGGGSATGRTSSFGYGSLGAGKPVHNGVMQAAAPSSAGRQLNATTTPEIGGPAQLLMKGAKNLLTRGANFAKGQLEGGGGGDAGGLASLAEDIPPIA